MHSSQRKHEAEAVAGVPERDKRRECQFYWRERCASQVLAGRPLPWLQQNIVGMRREESRSSLTSDQVCRADSEARTVCWDCSD